MMRRGRDERCGLESGAEELYIVLRKKRKDCAMTGFKVQADF